MLLLKDTMIKVNSSSMLLSYLSIVHVLDEVAHLVLYYS